MLSGTRTRFVVHLSPCLYVIRVCNAYVCKARFFPQKKNAFKRPFTERSAYLLPVVLDRHAEDALRPVACDLVHFRVEARVLEGKRNDFSDWPRQTPIDFPAYPARGIQSSAFRAALHASSVVVRGTKSRKFVSFLTKMNLSPSEMLMIMRTRNNTDSTCSEIKGIQSINGFGQPQSPQGHSACPPISPPHCSGTAMPGSRP